MIRTDDGHEKENLTQESVLYFDSQEQADAFMAGIENNEEAKENISYEKLEDGKVKVIY